MAERLGAVALLAVATVACARPSANTPTDAVRGAVAAIVAHDLRAAATHVCTEDRGDGPLPFIIPGITGAVDGLSFEEGFALIRFDASRLSVTEERRSGDEASVSLSGVLVERIDPGRYEAAYRAAVRARGEPVDRELLGQVLGLIGGGAYALPVDQVVRVVRQDDGAWKICDPGVTASPGPDG